MSLPGDAPADRAGAAATSEVAVAVATVPRARVLVVDDEPALRRSLARLLLSDGFDVYTAEDGPAGLALLATTRIDVVLLDTAMPGMSGIDVLRRIKETSSGVEVVMMAAMAELDIALAAVRAGAYHIVAKPFDVKETVSLLLLKAVEHKHLVERTRLLEQRLLQHEKFGELVGTSTRMRDVFKRVLGVAPTASTVFVHGESGTGKELVARAIHRHSLRSDRPLCVIDCAAFPDDVLQVELFGSVRGAGPGAVDRAGVFEVADKGTVVLDNIDCLSKPAQLKLFRTLAEGEIRRAGAPESRIVDVRVIAAAHTDLKQHVALGRFREDLYYRLSVIPIHLPPLRQRRDDIALLAYHFLQKYARRAGRDIRRIGAEALKLLREHCWPGNVRELENAIEHAVVTARGDVIAPIDLPLYRQAEPPGGGAGEGMGLLFDRDLSELSYADAKDCAVHAFDTAYLERLMHRTGGNVSAAARQAMMDRSNFRRLLKKVKLPRGAMPGDAGD